MPLIEKVKKELRVPINNVEIGGTVMMRQALCIYMGENLPNGNNPTNVKLDLIIEHYAVGPNDENGKPTFGERLIDKFPGIDRHMDISASSETLVELETGIPLCPTVDYERALAVAAANPDLDVDLPVALLNEDGSEKNFIRENDFFANIAENVPVIVRELERQHIQMASARGKFNF